MSTSEPTATKVSVSPSETVWLVPTMSAGLWLTSVTATRTSASVAARPSDTRTLKAYGVPNPPCASVGVQEKWPVVGSIAAPAGAPTSEKVRVGPSTSLACATNVYGASSGAVAALGTEVKTGGSFRGAHSTSTVPVAHFGSDTPALKPSSQTW